MSVIIVITNVVILLYCQKVLGMQLVCNIHTHSLVALLVYVFAALVRTARGRAIGFYSAVCF